MIRQLVESVGAGVVTDFAADEVAAFLVLPNDVGFFRADPRGSGSWE